MTCIFFLFKHLCCLLTLLCTANRAVSIFCSRAQAPGAQSEHQQGKVLPPPPGSHDARARWGEAGGRRRRREALRSDSTGDTGQSKVLGKRQERRKKKLHHQDSQRDAASCQSKKEAVKNFSLLHQTRTFEGKLSGV